MQVKSLTQKFISVKILTDSEDKHRNNNIGLYLLKAQYALEQRPELSDLLPEVNNLPCAYCDRLFQRDLLTIDHFKPRYFKGTNDPQNLVLACEPCNKAKGGIDPINMPITFQEFVTQVKNGIWSKRLEFLKQMKEKNLSENEKMLVEKLIRMESRPYLNNPVS